MGQSILEGSNLSIRTNHIMLTVVPFQSLTLYQYSHLSTFLHILDLSICLYSRGPQTKFDVPHTSFDKEALGRMLNLGVQNGQSLYTWSAGYHTPLGQHQHTQKSLLINMLVAKESILSSGTPFSVGVRSVRLAGNPIN